MRRYKRFVSSIAPVVSALMLSAVPAQQGSGQEPTERVAALKAAMAASQKQLRQYEWIETTIVSVKSDEKSRKQQRCYYGADGVLQKLPAGESAPPAETGGGRRRGGRMRQAIVENKKEELQDYMERAVALVHHYVPPSSDRLETARGSGKMALRSGASGGPIRLEISDYLKSGDRITMEVSPADSRLVGLKVASYLDTPENPVTLDVRFAALPDGTIYAAQSTLDASAKSVRVVVQNSGYRAAVR